MVASSERWTIQFPHGAQLGRIEIRQGLVLVVDPGRYEVFMHVEGSLTVSGMTMCPNDAARSSLESLRGQPVRRLAALHDGTLHIEFERETVIVPPDPDYEAWQLIAPGGVHVISLPGGGLAIWPTERHD